MLKHVSKTTIESEQIGPFKRRSVGPYVKYKLCELKCVRDMEQNMKKEKRERQSLSWPSCVVESKVHENKFYREHITRV